MAAPPQHPLLRIALPSPYAALGIRPGILLTVTMDILSLCQHLQMGVVVLHGPFANSITFCCVLGLVVVAGFLPLFP